MSEKSVMRSLNTDAARVRYTAGKGETKRQGAGGKREKEKKMEKDEREQFNELDGKGFLNSEGISNRAIPTGDSFPAARDPAILNFSRVEPRVA